ncbi:MAG: hypothetical protein KC502_12940 [Myxococcales bacterium]|nr:hypothetical protein [Myxococcales bacterium]
MTSLQQIHGQIEQLHAHYDMRFAGHARVTRNPQLMAAMIGELTQLQKRLTSIRTQEPESHAFVLGLLFERLGLYRQERAEIQKIQKVVGKAGVAHAQAMADANFILSRYHRHFGGAPRETRDACLLGELIGELKATLERVELFAAELDDTPTVDPAADVRWFQEHIQTLTTEQAAIQAAQDVSDPDTRGSILAELANGQFDRHRRHFNQRSRISLRPQLLADMVANLSDTHTQMQRLQTEHPFTGDTHQNMQVVQRHLAAWRNGLTELTELRAAATPSELMTGLITAVDAELGYYNTQVAGTAHGAQTVVVLGEICDRIGELARQMAALCEGGRRPQDHDALARARDARTMLSRSWAELVLAMEDAESSVAASGADVGLSPG